MKAGEGMGGMENLAIGVPYLSEAETGSWQVGMAWPAPLPPAPGYTGLHILFLFLPNLFFFSFPPTQLAWRDCGRDLGWVSFRRGALSEV